MRRRRKRVWLRGGGGGCGGDRVRAINGVVVT